MQVRMSVIAGVILSFCAMEAHSQIFSPRGGSADEKRGKVREQRDEILEELYRARPEMKERLKDAAGYATFKTRDVNLLMVASGTGYGVVVDKQGNETFMRVASLGGGLGVGLKDLRVIFIFNDADVMASFIRDGWQFGGKADAAAKYKDTGVAADQSVKATPDFRAGTVSGTASSDVRAGANDNAGGAAGASSGGPMEIYQFTESGVALQATVSGTKYWKDKDLN